MPSEIDEGEELNLCAQKTATETLTSHTAQSPADIAPYLTLSRHAVMPKQGIDTGLPAPKRNE